MYYLCFSRTCSGKLPTSSCFSPYVYCLFIFSDHGELKTLRFGNLESLRKVPVNKFPNYAAHKLIRMVALLFFSISFWTNNGDAPRYLLCLFSILHKSQIINTGIEKGISVSIAHKNFLKIMLPSPYTLVSLYPYHIFGLIIQYALKWVVGH